jgi:hypothetical protein
MSMVCPNYKHLNPNRSWFNIIRGENISGESAYRHAQSGWEAVLESKAPSGRALNALFKSLV